MAANGTHVPEGHEKCIFNDALSSGKDFPRLEVQRYKLLCDGETVLGRPVTKVSMVLAHWLQSPVTRSLRSRACPLRTALREKCGWSMMRRMREHLGGVSHVGVLQKYQTIEVAHDESPQEVRLVQTQRR